MQMHTTCNIRSLLLQRSSQQAHTSTVCTLLLLNCCSHHVQQYVPAMVGQYKPVSGCFGVACILLTRRIAWQGALVRRQLQRWGCTSGTSLQHTAHTTCNTALQDGEERCCDITAQAAARASEGHTPASSHVLLGLHEPGQALAAPPMHWRGTDGAPSPQSQWVAHMGAARPLLPG